MMRREMLMRASGLPRSYLFAPGHKPALFPKVVAAGADLAILDLEDAVPADAKEQARQAVGEWLAGTGAVALRVNGPGTAHWEAERALCRAPGVAAVLVPKVEARSVLDEVAQVSGDVPLLPMIETAAGLAHAETIARHPRVQRLVFGSLDFQLDLGITDDDEGLLAFRSHLVFISRVAGVGAPVDGVTPRFDSEDIVTRDAARARRLGFGGKLCIHPRQVGWVHACFGPTPDEVAWAERVVRAAEAAAGGATSVDGAMIDRPVIERAKTILQRAGPSPSSGT